MAVCEGEILQGRDLFKVTICKGEIVQRRDFDKVTICEGDIVQSAKKRFRQSDHMRRRDFEKKRF
jgi:hypothetical protein